MGAFDIGCGFSPEQVPSEDGGETGEGPMGADVEALLRSSTRLSSVQEERCADLASITADTPAPDVAPGAPGTPVPVAAIVPAALGTTVNAPCLAQPTQPQPLQSAPSATSAHPAVGGASASPSALAVVGTSSVSPSSSGRGRRPGSATATCETEARDATAAAAAISDNGLPSLVPSGEESPSGRACSLPSLPGSVDRIEQSDSQASMAETARSNNHDVVSRAPSLIKSLPVPEASDMTPSPSGTANEELFAPRAGSAGATAAAAALAPLVAVQTAATVPPPPVVAPADYAEQPGVSPSIGDPPAVVRVRDEKHQDVEVSSRGCRCTIM